MKTIYWVFAIAIFVLSLAQPALAGGCGQNTGRYTPTSSSGPGATQPAKPTGGAQPAGMPR